MQEQPPFNQGQPQQQQWTQYPPPQQQQYPQYYQQPMQRPLQPPFYPQQLGYPPQMPPAPQLVPKKASRLWLWIVLGVVGVFLLSCIGFFSLAGQAVKSTTTGTISTSSTVASSSSSNPSTSSQIAKVGQTITVNQVATTLVSVKLLAADEFTRPKPGNVFIVVHVKIVNTGSNEQPYNPFDFHVRAGSGNITNEEFVSLQSYTSNNELTPGRLSPGGSVGGDIIFQVPKGDHKAQLTWQPSFFGNAGDNAWNLGL